MPEASVLIVQPGADEMHPFKPSDVTRPRISVPVPQSRKWKESL